MVYEEIAPGSIVCTNNLLAGDEPIPAWGVVMEKTAFSPLFVAEKAGPKGIWPAGEEQQYGLFQQWGTLPSQGEGNRVVAGMRAFWEDPRYVGIRTFGDVFSDSLDRRLGLEIATQPHIRAFSLQDLEVIRYTRSVSHREAGSVPRAFKDVDFHMEVTQTYLQKGYRGTPADSLSRNGWNLVEQLRQGGVPEGGSPE